MRRPFPCLPFATVALVLLLPACAATGSGEEKAPEAAAAKAADAAKAAKQARAIEAAKRKVGQARLEQEAEKQKRAAAVEQTARELGLADHALEDFVVHVGPLRLRKAELALKSTEDDLTENLEELEQLKLMYAEQDLADRTREMVLHRTERRIEQRKEELDLARAELAHLKEDELTTEKAKLELEVKEKQQAHDAATIDARVAANDKAIELLEAENALADAEADAKASPDGAAGAARGEEEEDDGDED